MGRVKKGCPGLWADLRAAEDIRPAAVAADENGDQLIPLTAAETCRDQPPVQPACPRHPPSRAPRALVALAPPPPGRRPPVPLRPASRRLHKDPVELPAPAGVQPAGRSGRWRDAAPPREPRPAGGHRKWLAAELPASQPEAMAVPRDYDVNPVPICMNLTFMNRISTDSGH